MTNIHVTNRKFLWTTLNRRNTPFPLHAKPANVRAFQRLEILWAADNKYTTCLRPRNETNIVDVWEGLHQWFGEFYCQPSMNCHHLIVDVQPRPCQLEMFSLIPLQWGDYRTSRVRLISRVSSWAVGSQTTNQYVAGIRDRRQGTSETLNSRQADRRNVSAREH